MDAKDAQWESQDTSWKLTGETTLASAKALFKQGTFSSGSLSAYWSYENQHSTCMVLI